MYDAVDEKVTLDGVQQSYMTLGTIYEEIEPYDVPQKPSPTNFEREKQITIFTVSHKIFGKQVVMLHVWHTLGIKCGSLYITIIVCTNIHHYY